MLIYIILVFLLLFIIMLYTPINVRIEYSRKGQDDNFKLDIYTFVKFIGFSIHIPFLENRFLLTFTKLFAEIDMFFIKINSRQEKLDTAFEKEIEWENIQMNNIKKVFKILMDKTLNEIIINTLQIKCKKFSWDTEYGLSNPAYTGISNGFIWMFKGILLEFANELLTFLCEPELVVKPDFYKKNFSTHFSGIFFLRLGNIILTVIKGLLYKLSNLNYKIFFSLRLKSR